jgi:2',3'-cyclic-nucleotide 2'-phosphodiesterase
MSFNILCIGDVVGKPGRGVIADHLQALIDEHQVECVVCNAENAAGGSGLTPQIFDKLLKYGVDVVTLGDHIYRKKQIYPALETSDRIVKPANMPIKSLGRRWTVVPSKSGLERVAVVSVLGQMFMKNNDSPWDAVDRAMQEIPRDVKIRIVDFHAEATSEKIAMGYHLDGRATLVFGTHTHVPTADERLLAGGTAVISDVGMTGPYDSVLGRKKDRVLSFLTTGMPTSFELATDDVRLVAVLVDAEAGTGKARSIQRLEVKGRAHEGPVYDSDDGWGYKKSR